ncbi:MAG TPA: YSC84-related protein [Usitatibacter sp.]|jgi:lipid-binding SYLF domain-containing protein|nr:YSC84-related protein [Usitatibacter sp.]
MNANPNGLRLAAALFAASLAGAGISACTTTGPHDTGGSFAKRDQAESNVDATLARLYQAAPASREIVDRSVGVLVFPSVLNVGLVVGGEHGDGVLRMGGRTVDYYKTTGGSIGVQAGAQTKAEVIIFMTQESLDKFRSSHGWTVGADATVALAHIGANGSVDSETIRRPIVGFVLNNTGLMAGVSLEGTKISKLS